MSDEQRTLSCGEARRICWPDGSPRVMDDGVAAAEAHIAECAACRAFMVEMRDMAEWLAASTPRDSAPREVRERVFDALARARMDAERSRARRVVVRGLFVAGLAAIAILGIGVWRPWTVRVGAADITVRVAEDHRRVPRGGGITTTDSVLIGQWLSSRVGFTVRIPAFTNGQLVGARVADMDGVLGAVLAYRVDGRDVSYYLVPPRDATTRVEGTDPPAVLVSNWSGLGIAAWHEPRLTHVLVGDLPGARLSDLAHECIRQMTASLAAPNADRPIATRPARRSTTA